MPKNSLILPAILLTIICLVTTGLVALTYTMTLTARTEQAIITANANRRLLCPDAVEFVPIMLAEEQKTAGLTEAFTAQDANGRTVAWLFAAQFKGYGGQLPVLLAIVADGTISGIKILDNNETPGLGKKVASETFAGQFVGQGTDKLFTVKNAADGQQQIDAITGATISSRAVTSAVNLAVSFYRQNISEVK